MSVFDDALGKRYGTLWPKHLRLLTRRTLGDTPALPDQTILAPVLPPLRAHSHDGGPPHIDISAGNVPRVVSVWGSPFASTVGVGYIPLELVVLKIRAFMFRQNVFPGSQQRNVLSTFVHWMRHYGCIMDPLLYGACMPERHRPEERLLFCNAVWSILSQYDTPINLPGRMGQHIVTMIHLDYSELAINFLIQPLGGSFWLTTQDIMTRAYDFDDLPFSGKFWHTVVN